MIGEPWYNTYTHTYIYMDEKKKTLITLIEHRGEKCYIKSADARGLTSATMTLNAVDISDKQKRFSFSSKINARPKCMRMTRYTRPKKRVGPSQLGKDTPCVAYRYFHGVSHDTQNDHGDCKADIVIV